MPQLRLLRTLPLMLLAAACVDDPTTTVREPEPDPGPRVVGVYRFTITGISSGELRMSVAPVPLAPGALGAARGSLTPIASGGLTFETTSMTRVTHGIRGQGGQRYFTYTGRVHNGTGVALPNLTFIPVTDSTKYPGTPITSMIMETGASASPALAPKIVPSGFVIPGDEGDLRAPIPDVLQVFEESEVAAITLPAPYTYAFPYGFVMRNPSTPASRTLPATADPNDFSGAVNFAFRFPLQPGNYDPGAVSFDAIAVVDDETRITESMEEAHDTAAVRRLRERAAALGATTVTVMGGSSALDPAVPDYPGQRLVCTVRTAGPSGSPVTWMTEPAAYTEILVLRPGESVDPCGPYFRGGTPARPAYGVPFPVTAKALDLYGNVKTAEVDSIRMDQVSGPTATLGLRTPLVSGSATIQVTWFGFGPSLLRAVGRRNRGDQAITVAGITRVWSGNVSTDPGNPNNWVIGWYTGPQDTAYFPAGRPNYPVMVADAMIGGVVLESGATLTMGPYNLTASSLVSTETAGGITSTTGVLILTGTGTTLKGNLPRTHVTGSYSLAGPVASRARVEVTGGRLRTQGFRLQTTAN